MHIKREHIQLITFICYLAFLSNNYNISLLWIFKLKVSDDAKDNYEVCLVDEYFPINTYEVIDHLVWLDICKIS